MHFQPVGGLLAILDLASLVLLGAMADVAVKYEQTTPDELLILWCLIGGFCGSFCSLKFFQPKDYLSAGLQFGTNLCIATMVSPTAVYEVSTHTGWPVGLRLALPVALAFGIVGCNLVAWLIPLGQQYLASKARKWIPTDAADVDLSKSQLTTARAEDRAVKD